MNNDAYEAVIGLEVHAHMLTRSKLFCGCATDFGAPPNHNVCPVCMAMPGVLPVLNRHVLELAIRTGLAAHCKIEPHSVFARKSYFYPDLPKGYQISQYDQPLCTRRLYRAARRATAASRGGFGWCESISKRTPARISMPRARAWSTSTARACR